MAYLFSASDGEPSSKKPAPLCSSVGDIKSESPTSMFKSKTQVCCDIIIWFSRRITKILLVPLLNLLIMISLWNKKYILGKINHRIFTHSIHCKQHKYCRTSPIIIMKTTTPQHRLGHWSQTQTTWLRATWPPANWMQVVTSPAVAQVMSWWHSPVRCPQVHPRRVVTVRSAPAIIRLNSRVGSFRFVRPFQ